jgi:FkbM family methyltransferase
MASCIRQKIKAIPFVGAFLIKSNRLFIKVWREQHVFGKENRMAGNLKAFRKLVASYPTHRNNPVFVKVGANDGLTGDPCSDILVTDSRWKGLLIEPVPFLFSRLQENFADEERFKLDQVAVGPKGEAHFYYIDSSAKSAHPELPDWYDQIGSFDKSHIPKHFGNKLDKYVRRISLKSEPLSEILDRHGIVDCDLLHIDTEGFDFKVISTLDFSAVKPGLIFIEHKHLPHNERMSLLKLLESQSYVVRDCGSDYFAVIRNG